MPPIASELPRLFQDSMDLLFIVDLSHARYGMVLKQYLRLSNFFTIAKRASSISLSSISTSYCNNKHKQKKTRKSRHATRIQNPGMIDRKLLNLMPSSSSKHVEEHLISTLFSLKRLSPPQSLQGRASQDQSDSS